ncbi:trafficking protein particle complex subunit 8 [Geosmithia morbida]|uniref:Trafficking protein particle complex subunit 8 n=1 Tax=Geosmithia morbida TaxID=1094350 RepID=A0A9P4YZF9_9HYPO|nr:trafficking protein particle complex subunit 8 [Geosmithia morbida]KAF4125367.1 trafficking protein particle complex subunit 8 [Geosmithia morbida]
MPQSSHPRDDASSPTTEPIQALPAAAPIKKPYGGMTRPVSGPEPLLLSSMFDSETGLSFRRSNPSAASLYASTLSPPGSRPMSPAGRASPSRVLSGTAFDSAYSRPFADGGVGSQPGDPLNIIVSAFVPHIAIRASADVEKIAAAKGFRRGLWELLRPFGEHIQGKLAIRDSNGVSKLAEDFSVRFTKFGANVEYPDPAVSGFRLPNQGRKVRYESTDGEKKTLANVEAVVDKHLSYAEDEFRHTGQGVVGFDNDDNEAEQSLASSPYYSLYLRRLLSGLPIVPHETFAHPVACIIAVSARSDDSVAELRQLYSETSQGADKLPDWVDANYLRYHVLVHDEENDDITKSTALFEQMKRHLGLHCHLLRLRTSQSAETDDDSIPLPRSDWMSADDELAEIHMSEGEGDGEGEDGGNIDGSDGFEAPTRYIFESDATAIRTFVREMVAQSIVPTMERHVSIWNDQVASRRRGLAGRFMNLSRKFNFGGSSRSSLGAGGPSKDSYDPSGFFRADAPEAVMRKLADYAFMLRDWKLAHSTYELLRSDYADFKAWKYHAACNEMAAVSLLIQPQQISAKSRRETVDQMLESAFYSYSTRCSAPYGALRSLVLTLELLRLRGGTNIDDASRWGLRLLDAKILGPVGDALIKERVAVCYGSKEGVGSSWNWGGRRRKSAAWSILAADAWIRQSRYLPARKCLDESHNMYALLPSKQGISHFHEASLFLDSLQRQVTEKLGRAHGHGHDVGGYNGAAQEAASRGQDDENDGTDEESEAMVDTRPRRSSTARHAVPIETAPLQTGDAAAATAADHNQDGDKGYTGFDKS